MYVNEYPSPYATCDIVLFKRIASNSARVLLVKRKNPPFQGSWCLPGGFMNENETALQGAQRELCEETGIDNLALEQFFTFTSPGRDPRHWTISVAHRAIVQDDATAVAGDDAADACWFSLSVERDAEQTLSMHLSDEKNGELNARVKPSPGDGILVENSGLAFDHALILAKAVEGIIEI